MGCSSSVETANAPEPSQKQLDEIMGKQIPKFVSIATTNNIRLPSQESDNEAQEIKEQLQRNQKKAQKKFKGGDDVQQVFVENVIRSDKQKIQKSDAQLIEKSFKSHFVFSNMTQQAIETLINSMTFCTQSAGQFIFKQGDQATCYFVIQKGSVEIQVNEKVVKVIDQGGYFGEIALLYNAPRSASIMTISDCNFWVLDRASFKKSIEDMVSKEYDENRKFIEQVKFFSFMTPEQKDAISHALITQRFDPGQSIVEEGDQADSYFVIKSGTVEIFRGKQLINTMGPKDSFGEQALYTKSTRGATVKAKTEVKCLALARDILTTILGDKVQIIIFNNLMTWSFDKSPVLSQLTKLQKEKIRMKAHIKSAKAGDKIFSKGFKCSQVVIVLDGQMSSDKETIMKGVCYGDQYLAKEHSNFEFLSDYKLDGDGVIATINFEDIFKILGGTLEQALHKNVDNHENKIRNIEERPDASYIKVEDLIFIQKLGSGQFGWVYMVKHVDHEECFALKSVSKASIVEQGLERHILQEKYVLETCNFPFIMPFYRTFKDDISIYFLVQCIRGMELFDVIRELNLMDKRQTQFYIGTMILCLEYMHFRGIIYRDLKPENIMVDHRGIMIMIDMGTAKQISRSKGQRTYTIIGTPHYMAPEVILGKGYSYPVDIWSVGVCAYEFLCGNVPFGEDVDDPYEIYEEIMATSIRFPSHYSKDRAGKKFIEQLLNKQPEARLGTSFSALKANQWFDDFDWDKLFNKQIKPPFIPPADKLIDQNQIDRQFKLHKPVVEQIKEEQKQQKIKYSKNLAKDPNWDKSF